MPAVTNDQEFSIAGQWRLILNRMSQSYRQWSSDDLTGASQSMALRETHLPRLLIITVIILCGATALFLVWATLTPVKEIARTEGQVLPAGYNQLVQHLEGGLVRQILVHEGDFVQKDQLLLELDGAGLEEDYQEQKALVAALLLQQERLKAMLENRTPNFTSLSPSAASVSEQKRMYDTMRDARNAERAIIDEQIAQKNKMLERLRQSIETSSSNLKVARESSNIYADLNQKGLTAKTTYLKKQQELNTQQGETQNLTSQLEEGKRELSEYVRRREALVAQQRDTSYTQLNKIQSELSQAQENLKKRNDRVIRLEVRAPVTGYVKGMRVNTIGSVIPAGQTLLEIVPIDEQLIIEARILPQQVGRVSVGQDVQIKVDSYDYVRFGSIPGKLESISAMTFSDEIRRQDYYKGRIKLSRSYAGNSVNQHPVLPGMTVDADIVTGEKSVLGYLLKPIQVAMRNAMTEQ